MHSNMLVPLCPSWDSVFHCADTDTVRVHENTAVRPTLVIAHSGTKLATRMTMKAQRRHSVSSGAGRKN